jgi:hypothetical protein
LRLFLLQLMTESVIKLSLAALERKKAFVADQQRELAAMVQGADPPWKRPRVANASVAPPVKAWTHWSCSCVMRNTHPVSHAICHRCGADQQVMETEAIAKSRRPPATATAMAKDRMVLRPKAKVMAGKVPPVAPEAPWKTPANVTLYKYTTPPGPPSEPVYMPPKLMVVNISESKDSYA